jgi:hypothetical protein
MPAASPVRDIATLRSSRSLSVLWQFPDTNKVNGLLSVSYVYISPQYNLYFYVPSIFKALFNEVLLHVYVIHTFGAGIAQSV